MKTVKLTINGFEIEVAEGTSVLQACLQMGIEIPRFCYHEALTIAGSCRMCLVEVKNAPKPVASCTMPCAEGMVVETDTPKIHKARQGVMEFLLINHPLDCPVCDQGGECDLQDLAVAYGRDRSRFKEPKRIVQNKNLGPLIKTNMTRCIHCTRCIRFADEIAGTPDLGGLFRGEHLEITNEKDKPLLSELSGNLADICPVGALTSKPHAFEMRSWELKGVPSVDVSDAIGSSIRLDVRGDRVMRVMPHFNPEINENWIHDKARYSFDGLRLQRLDRPYIRQQGKLCEATWEEALGLIAEKMRHAAPETVAAIAGDLVDCESMMAMKTFMQAMGSPNMDCRQDGATYDVSERCGYLMNTPIQKIDKVDAVLLIGTNPRHEAAILNARLRKRWLKGGCRIGRIGAQDDLGFPVSELGDRPSDITRLMNTPNVFADYLKNANYSMLIVGAGALAREDGASVHELARALAEKMGMVRKGWNGFNVLQQCAARVGGLDLGFVPGARGMGTNEILKAAQNGQIKMLYLLGADEIPRDAMGEAFVIYQGHHGDQGASGADVVLPGVAYTEKDVHYINAEGRAQRARQAVQPPEGAVEDWAIIKALADEMGLALPFEDKDALRGLMARQASAFAAVGDRQPSPWRAFGHGAKSCLLEDAPFESSIKNFYRTDVISRTSPTMARCTEEILPYLQKKKKGGA